MWFRDHALRIRDNDALDAAAKDAKRSSDDLAPRIPTGGIVPVYLWTSSSSSSVDDATGGTASDVFVANALDHLNRTLFGRLSLGLVVVPSVEESHDGGAEDLARVCADEITEICRRAGASEVYYTESFDEAFEDALREGLNERGLLPRSFPAGHTLLDYSKEPELPWKEIIEAHPFRSPLIPFVDYLLDRLEHDPPPPPKPEPLGLEEMIAAGHPSRGDDDDHDDSHAIVTRPLAIADLRNTVGYTRTRTNWGSSIATAWAASEEAAAATLESFLDSLPPVPAPGCDSSNSGSNSTTDNNEGHRAEPTTTTITKRTHLASRLSPYLARGLLSPRQVYHALSSSSDRSAARDRASFVRRICWRDYTYAVVSLFPDVTAGRPIREGYYDDDHHYERAPNKATTSTTDGSIHREAGGSSSSSPRKKNNHRGVRLWKRGATGFPLVDAGMRQLAEEGWMPQKVRLAVSTCLVEGLGGSWEAGMEHFAEFLVDYDPAINANMWMNAGCVGFDPYYVGTDYKRRPYWDKTGEYVRKWCPELGDLPDAWAVPEAQRGIGSFNVDCLYEPWSAPADVLKAAGVVLGRTYPHRCTDDREARKRFFGDLRRLREGWPPSNTDDRGRDKVRLGRQRESASVGMFTPRALLVVGNRKKPPPPPRRSPGGSSPS